MSQSYYTRPIVIDGVEWQVAGGVCEYPRLSWLPIVVNGMKPAYGLDANGNEIYGWIREMDLLVGMYPWLSPEEQFQAQLDREQRLYEMGIYWLFINLYSDKYATEVIGGFKVVAYPNGQAAVHGFGSGVIYLD